MSSAIDLEKNPSISFRAISLMVCLSLSVKNPWVSPRTAWFGLGNLSNIEIQFKNMNYKHPAAKDPIYKNFNFDTKILAASMRNSIYVKEAALSGAHVATIPPDVIHDMLYSELTEISLDGFLEEWRKLPEEKRNYFDK